jgi:phospholipase C
MIRFLEARLHITTDLFETNITPWRRAVAGDLTTAFDKHAECVATDEPAEHGRLQA